MSGKPEFMLVGIDNKVTWGDDGKVQNLPPGNDAVTIVDIGSDPANPKIVANLPLMNSIFGPPTNLAITPNGQLALVANSMDWAADGAGWKAVPDNKLYVIDLTTSPPRLIDTVAVGKQPSGMSINRAGNLALIANRADNSLSVLSIEGKSVKLVDTVVIGEHVAHVVFTPDGKRAMAGKFPGHKVALLSVDGQKVTYTKRDLAVGLWPYNLDVTPDGRLALTADNGNAGGSDGNVDTVSVIDLEAKPERVIDKVVVGDAPEGFAISPNGKLAVAVLLRGSNNAKTEFFYNRNGSVVLLEDRRQEGQQDRRGRGARPARGRRVQPRRPLAVCGQLHGFGLVGAAGRWRHGHQHRHADQAAGQAGVDAGAHAVAAAVATLGAAACADGQAGLSRPALRGVRARWPPLHLARRPSRGRAARGTGPRARTAGSRRARPWPEPT